MKLHDALSNSRYMQYLAVITATISIASVSTYMSWSSPSIPKLVADDSPLGEPITPIESSWVAASFIMGGIPASVVAGLSIEKFGRRKILLLSAIPMFGPWIMLFFAKTAWVLILARFIAGFGSGFILTAVPMFNGEIAEKDIRGKLGLSTNLMMNAGSLLVLAVGPFVSYRILIIICSVLPLLFFLLFYFMPESPYYLLKKGEKDAARNNLVRLSSNIATDKMVDEYLLEIENTIERDMQNKSTLWEFLSKQEYRKSLIIMLGINFMQHGGGTTGILGYMQTIVESTNSSVSAENSSIIFGVTQIIATLISAALVDKMGRKILLIISALGCAVFLIAEGTYFYVQDVVKADTTNLAWLPTTSLTLYSLMNHIGVFSVPYVLMGELFATNIKGVAVSLFTVYGAVLSFLVVKLFEPIVDAWGMYTMFWIYAGISISGAAFVLIFLPETKGKTFAEIQRKLNRNKHLAINS